MDSESYTPNSGQSGIKPESTDILSEKQRLILKSALQLFAERGYNGTTTLAIAQRANVAEKTLFKYYHTKQELFDRALHYCMEKLVDPKNDIDYFRGRTGYDILHTLFLHKLKLIEMNPDFLKIMMQEFLVNENFRSVMVKFWRETFLPHIVSKIEICDETKAEYGDIIDDSLSLVIVCQMLGYALAKTFDSEKKLDDEKQISLILDILFNGLNSLNSKGVQ
jgi:AcrR family transcriptional regulator